jgi:SAM-dependent methyltransferase
MHINSLNIMKKFVEEYVADSELKILDLGSRVVNGQQRLGSYRQFFTNKKWSYLGADTGAGRNVDITIKDYDFPFKAEEFDVIISGQTIEHVEYPWKWFREMARVLKVNGVCCIIAPAKIYEHKFPIDTFRYYPDGMAALAKWSGLNVIKVERLVVDNVMEDTYLIAKKGTKKHVRT